METDLGGREYGYGRRRRWRIAVLESVLRWVGGISKGDACRILALSGATAQADVNHLRECYGAGIEREPATRRWRLRREYLDTELGHEIDATDCRGFLAAVFGARAVRAYLGVDIGDPGDGLVVEDLGEILSPPLLRHSALATVFACHRGQTACEILYTNKKSTEIRIVSPSAFFKLDGRHYMRAWCHTKRAYLHFSLGRIDDARPVDYVFVPGGKHDSDWVTKSTLLVSPHPDLKQSEKTALIVEWEIQSNKMPITVRKCLVQITRRWLESQTFENGSSKWIVITE